MVSGPERLEGASLLQHDVVAKHSVSAGEQPNLSGFIDILQQFKDEIQSPYTVVDIDPQPFMEGFFHQVHRIKQDMTVIENSIHDMRILHHKILTEVSRKKNKEQTECLDNLMTESSAAAKKVKAALQCLHPTTSDSDSPRGITSATLIENKIKANMQGALTRRFVELMTRYHAAQAEHNALARERLGRARGLANPRASKQEIEAALSAYQDVASKHEELVRLESSIRELHQLFVDMAIMVETQGEMLDNIEENVSTTVEYTEEGVVQLHKAKISANQARKKTCMLALCFAFVLAILLAWFSSFIPRF